MVEKMKLFDMREGAGMKRYSLMGGRNLNIHGNIDKQKRRWYFIINNRTLIFEEEKMQDINIKFKDYPPEITVECIKNSLAKIGIVLEEEWNDTGIENCWSVHVFVKDAYPFFANGKGITKELARASAYGEFIERLQCGLLLYKFQSITRDPAMNLHSYAPDGVYLSKQDLIDNGDWMDHIIKTYGGNLSREKLAKQCQIYACTEEDKIWSLPFYSIFEDKYVYLPAGFVEHMYSGNGCCAGNTREEAWVHAFSEMMERRCTVMTLLNGKAVPQIPEELIRQYSVPSKILDTIRATGNFDVQLFDFSQGNGFPVVATRMIDKKTHRYLVNICADPVLEIAIDRTLTEIFQGRRLKDFAIVHNGNISNEIPNMPKAHNVLNQLENGNGLFSLDFFTEEASGEQLSFVYTDNTEKDNKELLKYMLDLYQKMGRPVYIRNYSFLGFHSYHIVVPGFSECRGMKLTEPIQEYALADAVQSVFRNVQNADNSDLMLMLSFYGKVCTAFSRQNNYCGLAGLPLDSKLNVLLTSVTLAYAAYKLKRYSQAVSYLKQLLTLNSLSENDRDYFHCVSRYIGLLEIQADAKKIRLFLEKFYDANTVEKMYSYVDSSKTPFEPFLMKCGAASCVECRYQNHCTYDRCTQILERAGEHYMNFKKGQTKEFFRN